MDSLEMASSLQTLTRICFRIGEHLSPEISGKLAFALFCRTRNPNRISDKEREALAKVRPFMDRARCHFLPVRGGGAIAAYQFEPTRPKGIAGSALVVHGWNSRADHMAGIIDALLEHGLRVIAIDLPGHGQSPGRSLNMHSAVAAVFAAAERYGPFRAVVGHSFGGAVALNAIAGSVEGLPSIETDRLILVSAPNSMPEHFAKFSRFIALGSNSSKMAVERVQEVTGRPFHCFVGSHQLRRTALPTLAIHAPEDREVPASDAAALAKAGSHVRLSWAPGLGHRRILNDRDVLAKIGMFAVEGEHLKAVA